jgi:hypothetical protein
MKIVVEKSWTDSDDDVIRIINSNNISFCNIYKGGHIVFPENYIVSKGLPTKTFNFLVEILQEQELEEKNDVAPGN